MTKHCCQGCFLSMMFCRSDSRLCADMVSDGAIGTLEYHVVLTTLWQANAGNDMKDILYVWFSHFPLTETHRWWNYSLSLHFNKKNKNYPVLTHSLTTSKPSLKLLDCGWTIQTDVWYRYILLHTRTHIMMMNWHNSDHKCAEWPTYWQFFYYRPLCKLRWTVATNSWGYRLKGDVKNSTYVPLSIIYISHSRSSIWICFIDRQH